MNTLEATAAVVAPKRHRFAALVETLRRSASSAMRW